ncbi:MAG: M48 family metalloprotease, partial [Desulfobacterales bacterium]|nr:M48 family metalloprotease [Desulfobacterales bacterium]
MIRDARGQLVLKSMPRGDQGRAVVHYLAGVFKNAPMEKIARLIEKPPVVLNREMPETAGKKIILDLEKLGAVAVFSPGDQDENGSSQKRKQDLRDQILKAFTGKPRRQKASFLYTLGLFMVAAAMTVPLIAYAGVISLICYALGRHIFTNHVVFSQAHGLFTALLVYGGPILAGGLLLLFLAKPLFARRGPAGRPWRVDPDEEPFLHEFVRKLAKMVGAPAPREIAIDMDVNARASFRGGFRGLFRRDLVLTFGMPLAAGLSLNQFAGVLAHELGHFSQSAGMMFTCMIRSIHLWFQRKVYEEDHWDERIRQWRGRGAFRLGLVFTLVRGGVRLTRGMLWLLMTPGRMISCFMLRQMEYDADRHEIFIAGSAMFTATERSMANLTMALDWAWEDLRRSWEDKRLPDDFPALVVANSRQVPLEKMQKNFNARLEAPVGFFSTHPSTAVRIARADRLAEPGLFHPGKSTGSGASEIIPANILFEDFSALSKRATLDFLHEVLGAGISADNLTSTDSVSKGQDSELIFLKVLDRFFLGQFGPLRPLGIREKDVFSEERALKALSRLKSARQAIRDGAPAREGLLKRLRRLTEEKNGLAAARALVKAGVSIAPREFGLKTPDLYSIEMERHAKSLS